MFAEREILLEWKVNHVHIRVRADHIVEYTIDDNSRTTLADQMEITQSLINRLGMEKKYALVVVSGDFAEHDPEAIRYGRSTEDTSPFICSAIVAPSLPKRLAANFYFTVFKPTIAYRLVATMEEGEAWGMKQLEKNHSAGK